MTTVETFKWYESFEALTKKGQGRWAYENNNFKWESRSR